MNFRHLEANRKGRKAINKNYLLCRAPGMFHHIDPGGKDLMNTSATPVSGILEFMEPSFVQKFLQSPEYSITKSDNGTYSFSGLNDRVRLRMIACKPFTAVMNEVNISNIDVWILDVEGLLII
jgi:hypothetical protein